MNENYYRRGATQRHEVIVQLIRSGSVESQVELRRLLARRGIRVAQPTLSRDLRVLGLAKTPRGYLIPDGPVARFAPTAMREAKLRRALQEFALAIRAAGSLVVVKTPPAAAQPVARALDEVGRPSIVGTIAGDDTVFVATPTGRSARALARSLTAAVERQRGKSGG
jgi:transcriptional regulator of arginine metabolism